MLGESPNHANMRQVFQDGGDRMAGSSHVKRVVIGPYDPCEISYSH